MQYLSGFLGHFRGGHSFGGDLQQFEHKANEQINKEQAKAVTGGKVRLTLHDLTRGMETSGLNEEQVNQAVARVKARFKEVKQEALHARWVDVRKKLDQGRVALAEGTLQLIEIREEIKAQHEGAGSTAKDLIEYDMQELLHRSEHLSEGQIADALATGQTHQRRRQGEIATFLFRFHAAVAKREEASADLKQKWASFQEELTELKTQETINSDYIENYLKEVNEVVGSYEHNLPEGGAVEQEGALTLGYVEKILSFLPSIPLLSLLVSPFTRKYWEKRQVISLTEKINTLSEEVATKRVLKVQLKKMSIAVPKASEGFAKMYRDLQNHTKVLGEVKNESLQEQVRLVQGRVKELQKKIDHQVAQATLLNRRTVWDSEERKLQSNLNSSWFFRPSEDKVGHKLAHFSDFMGDILKAGEKDPNSPVVRGMIVRWDRLVSTPYFAKEASLGLLNDEAIAYSTLTGASVQKKIKIGAAKRALLKTIAKLRLDKKEGQDTKFVEDQLGEALRQFEAIPGGNSTAISWWFTRVTGEVAAEQAPVQVPVPEAPVPEAPVPEALPPVERAGQRGRGALLEQIQARRDDAHVVEEPAAEEVDAGPANQPLPPPPKVPQAAPVGEGAGDVDLSNMPKAPPLRQRNSEPEESEVAVEDSASSVKGHQGQEEEAMQPPPVFLNVPQAAPVGSYAVEVDSSGVPKAPPLPPKAPPLPRQEPKPEENKAAVEEDRPKAQPPKDRGRADLLAAIRGFNSVRLKKAAPKGSAEAAAQKASGTGRKPEEKTMDQALQERLAARRNFVQESEKGQEESDSDNEEWNLGDLD